MQFGRAIAIFKSFDHSFASRQLSGLFNAIRVAKVIRQLGCKGLIIVIEPPITFLPRLRSLTSKLFSKVFPNERVRVQMPRIVQIFSGEES